MVMKLTNTCFIGKTLIFQFHIELYEESAWLNESLLSKYSTNYLDFSMVSWMAAACWCSFDKAS